MKKLILPAIFITALAVGFVTSGAARVFALTQPGVPSRTDSGSSYVTNPSSSVVFSSSFATTEALEGDLMTINVNDVPAVYIGNPHTIDASDVGMSSTTSFTVPVSSLGADGSKVFSVTLYHAVDMTSATSTNSSPFTLDTVIPEFQFEHIQSGSASSTLAGVGATVTLTASSTEPIASSTVLIAGHVATKGSETLGASGQYETPYTVTMQSGDVAGLITYSVVGYDDVAGNPGSAIPTPDSSLDNSSVIFDPTPPVVSSVHIASLNASTTLAKAGDTITITANTNEEISAGSGTMFAATLLSFATTSPTTAVFTGTVAPGNSGPVPFSFTVTDVAGNVSTATTSTSDNSSVSADTSAPTIAITYNINHAVKSGASLAVTATPNEALVTAPYLSIAGANTLATTSMATSTLTYTFTHTVGLGDGNAYLTFASSTDAAGNEVEMQPTSGNFFVVDNTPPALPTITSVAGDGKINSSEASAVVVTGSAEANALATVTLSDGTNTAASSTQLTGGATLYTVTVDAHTLFDGLISSAATATDVAGNTSGSGVGATALKNTAIPLAPTFSLPSFINSTGSTTVSLSGTGQGNTIFSYSLSDLLHFLTGTSTVSSGGAIAVSGLNLSAFNEGTVSATGTITDAVGNVSAVGSTSSTKDTAGPSFTGITPANASYIRNATSSSQIAYSLLDALSSGQVVFSQTSGADASSTRSCFLAGSALTVGSHTLNLGDTTNGCSSAQTLVSGSVYNAVFSGIDLALNAGPSATVTGFTFDDTRPSLTEVSIISSSASSTLAKAGDTITVYATSSEPLASISGTIAGHAAIVATTTAGTSFMLTAVVAPGDTSAFLVGYTDLAGNAGPAVSATTDGSQVTVDTTAPTASLAYLPTHAVKAGDALTITATLSEPIADSPVLTMALSGANTLAASVMTKIDGTHYATTTIVRSGNGSTTIAFGAATDLAGNAITVTPTANDSYLVDNTAPVVSVTTPTSPTNNNTPTLSLTSNEAGTLAYAGCSSLVSSVGASTDPILLATLADGSQSCAVGVTDVAGNTATATTNSFIVDTVPPTIALSNLVSSNASSTLAKTGDTVTASSTMSESVSSVSATIAGRAAVVTGSGRSYAASLTLNGTESEGLLPVAWSFTDGVNAVTPSYSVATDGSAIRFDKTAPTLSSVAIASNNANTVLAKVGDTVTVSVTSGEALSGFSGTIFGRPATVATTSPTSFTLSTIALVTDAEGSVPFSLAFTDLAGNVGTAVTATTNASAVTFDRTAPTLSSVLVSSNNASTTLAKVGDTVTLTITSDEALMSPDTTVIAGHLATVTGGGTSWTASYVMTGSDLEGVVPFTIAFKDAAGNSGTSVSASTNASAVTFDRTVPVVSAGTGTLASTTALQNASASDAGVGIASYQWSQVSGPGTLSFGTPNAEDTTVSATADGVYVMNLAVLDHAGNAASSTAQFTWDSTAPTFPSVSILSSNASTTLATVGDTVTLSFATDEPVQTPNVSIAGHVATLTDLGGATSWTASATIALGDMPGLLPFTLNARDLAGNPAVALSATTDGSAVTIDNIPPTLPTVSIASNNASTTLAKSGDLLTLNFSADERLQTPTVTLAGHVVTPLSADAVSWTATTTMLGTDAEGTVPFSIAYKDLVGNSGFTTSTTTNATAVVYDRTAPTFTLAATSHASGKVGVGAAIPVTLTFSEPVVTQGTISVNYAGGGASSFVAQLESASSTTYTTQSGENTYHLNVTGLTGTTTDAAGNPLAVTTPTTNLTPATDIEVDTTPPADITDLLGTPSVDLINFRWTAPAATDTAAYDLRYSRSPITSGNFAAATAVSDEPVPFPGIVQQYSLLGLRSTSTYYMALRSRDDVFNYSGIASVGTTTTETANPLIPPPVVSTLTPTTTANTAPTTLTLTGDHFVDITNEAILQGSNGNVVHLPATYVSTTTLTVSVPAGMPSGTYTVLVQNANGSSNTKGSFTVAAVTSAPEVTNLLPIVAPTTAIQQLDIYGTNFTGATAVKLSNGTTLTSLTIVDATHLRATVPSGVAAGEYDVRVTTPNGTNTVSAAKLAVVTPVVVTNQSSIETNSVLSLASTSTLPATTLTNDLAKEPVHNGTLVEVDIDSGTSVSNASGTPYTGNILPPRAVRADAVQAANLLDDAVVLEMGSTSGLLTFNKTFVAQVTVEGTTQPKVLYWNGSTYALAGVSGSKNGKTFAPGGTLISSAMLPSGLTQFTIGVLLDHMSIYVATLPPTIGTIAPREPYAKRTPRADGFTLSGGNFHSLATVTLGGVPLTPDTRSGSSMSFTVPDSFAAGTYALVITNPSTLAAQTDFTLLPFSASGGSTGGGGGAPAQNMAPFTTSGGGGGGGGGTNMGVGTRQSAGEPGTGIVTKPTSSGTSGTTGTAGGASSVTFSTGGARLAQIQILQLRLTLLQKQLAMLMQKQSTAVKPATMYAGKSVKKTTDLAGVGAVLEPEKATSTPATSTAPTPINSLWNRVRGLFGR